MGLSVGFFVNEMSIHGGKESAGFPGAAWS